MALPVRPEELEAAAKQNLTAPAYAYYAAGAGSEATVAENTASWARWHLRPRILNNVHDIRLETTVLGTATQMPVFTAPCAFNRLAHEDGEIGVARAAAEAGIVQVLSTTTSTPLEEVAAATNAPKWYQLYYIAPEVAETDALIKRAEEAGFKALVITVDLAMMGIRYEGLRDVAAFGQELHSRGIRAPTWPNPGLDWDEVERIRGLTSMPIVLKGVLHPQDARLAVERGIDAIVVSNHGGRQLDGAIPTALALPEIVEIAGNRVEVYVDGGIRTGVDVLRALALGARAVLVGRPYLWALAIDGQAGVDELLTRIRRELRNAMGLSGQTDVSAVDPSIVVPAR